MSNRSTTGLAARQLETDEVALDMHELLSAAPAVQKIDGVVVGRLVGFGPSGQPLVDFPCNPAHGPLPAKTISLLKADDEGRQVAVMFEAGDSRRPMVMGLLWVPGQGEVEPAKSPGANSTPVAGVEVDDERLEITAKKEIVLRCGKASITLTRAGKVLVRGAYLLSRSSGANQIKGGSIQLN